MDLGLIDAGNWSVSASWQIPTDAVSGVYFAKLTREDGTTGENLIPFIVRDDASTSDIVFQTSDTTWEAYNPWGGANLYGGDVPLNPNDMIAYMPPNCHCGLMAIGRAYAVSYNRPFITSTDPNFLYSGPQDYIFGEEFPAIQWLEQNGYDVTYISGVDAARSGSTLLNHDVYLSVGHDEYWSGEQRDNVTAARDAGVNLAFWSGNECYWKVQWNDSIDGSGTPYRTMTCYKETWANADINPAEGSTATWRDTRFADPGQEPENSLTGTLFSVDSWRTDTITIPYDMTQLRIWRNTAVAETQPGETASLVNGLLGYEWDSDVDNGFRPAGLIDLSLSTISVDTYLMDYGSTVGTAEATHSLTMYRDQESGALVFGAGTVMWSWGLNDQHDLPGVPVDPNVQQAMVNMFADMGVQPTTLDASLVLATQSTDFAAPVSTITSPTAGAALTEGQKITITGTAADSGGGQVAGIEVSVDGGQTWHKATGTTNWSYSWIAQASGTYTIESRAADDSLNLELPSDSRTITVSLPPTDSLWSYAAKPANDTEVDRTAIEVGMKFVASVGGTVSGIKFYKGAFNIGTHTASLWTTTGTLLATATFTGETQNGWQTATFSSPVTITAGMTYVASYHTDGYYAQDEGYFTQPVSHGVLSAPVDAGVMIYSDTSAFPTSASGDNYWVDVLFSPSGGQQAGNSAPAAQDDTGLSTARNAVFSIDGNGLTSNDTDADGDHLSVTSVGGAVHGTVTFSSLTQTILFTPDADYSGPASFTYTVTDGWGGNAQANVSLTVNDPGIGLSLFDGTAKPQNETYEGTGIELGVTFVASASGTISGIRYYKSAAETGTHTGSLWSSTGTLLATATFTNESVSGWQTATFSQPVQITAGASYVASYHSNGTYESTIGYFDSSYANGPLSTPADAGVYAYSAGGTFPTNSYDGSNYWVDVVYNETTGTNTAPTAVDDSGFATGEGNVLVIPVAQLTANDNDIDGDALTVTGVSNATNGSAVFDAQSDTVTFTPATGYTGTAGFTYSISDGRGGASSAHVSLTVDASGTHLSLFSPSDTPSETAAEDGNGVELGLRFSASSTGTITGISYYKSSLDVGTHTGSLWSSTGTLLASVTFTNETASGWQTASFSSPVTIAAGQTYVASFHSNGYYADSAGYFDTAYSNGPLSAPADAGVYSYGSTSVFPTNSFNGTNYWVDVVYDQSSAANVAPVANNDNGIETAQDTPKTIAAATLLANDTDADGDTLTITGVSTASNGAVSFDQATNVVTFTPTAGYTGTAGFTYTISDGQSHSASAQVSLSVTPSGVENLIPTSTTPAITSDSDPGSVELGVRFAASVSGQITAISYYKSANDVGTHTGALWSGTGTLLASGTFTNETASGWQTLVFSSPVAITAGTTYVAGYHSNGYYAATPGFFDSAYTNGDLTAPVGAGVYGYGDSGTFPTASYGNTSYSVSVQFVPGAGSAPENVAPVANPDSGFTTTENTILAISASALLANDTDADGDSLTVTGVSTAQNGTATFDAATGTISFTPATDFVGDAGFTYAIADGQGGTASSQVSLSIVADPSQQSLFAGLTPTVISVDDPNPVELGVKFQSDVAGQITGIRFYKGADNTGLHVGDLWTSTGTLLASATFTNETDSGWQTVDFATPVEIAADTTYVAAYHTNGNYSASAAFFDTTVQQQDLLALSDTAGGGNGVYAYGTTDVFPTNSFNKTNYYVDVVFKPQVAA